MPMVGIGEPVRRSSRSSTAPVGARARRRPSRRRAHPLRRPGVPRVDVPPDDRRVRDAGHPRGAGAGPGDGRGRAADRLSTTFAQDAVGEHRGYEYARSDNPTRSALETSIAALEGRGHGLAFASGMAAEDAVLARHAPARRSRDHPRRRVRRHVPARGARVRARRASSGPPSTSPTTTRSRPRGETEPRSSGSRPRRTRCSTVVDIAAVATFAHERGALVVVDNTFATPYLQQPLGLGADVVVHSSTKYLGGHSDVVGGFVAVDDRDLAERIAFVQNAAGGVPGPFDCYLVLRGVKTLAVRMDRHCENARAVAALLAEHPAVARRAVPGSRPPIPATRSPAARCGTSAGWCRSSRRAARTPRSARREHPPVHAGGVARCGRVADRAPGAHDARVGRGLTPRGRPRARPPLGRHRDAEDLVADLRQALDAVG